MDLLTSITFGKLLFILFSIGILTIAIVYAWDECTRREDQELFYEDRIKKLEAENLALRWKCESDEPGWCEVCAVVYEEDDPCSQH